MIQKYLESNYQLSDKIYQDQNSSGYWSNLSKDDQKILFSQLNNYSTQYVIRKYFPQHYDVIFNPRRAVGLKLLEIKQDEIGVDYGCMWGGLLIHAAKSCKEILGIDQTYESLKFLRQRIIEEGLENSYLLNMNLRSDFDFQALFDFAIVNGVLEWIPETKNVHVNDYLAKKNSKYIKSKHDPRKLQLEFLKKVNNGLRTNGRLFLAIENRFDYQFFLWKKDPHTNTYYTAFLPRRFSNFISNIYSGRPYVNYIYSYNELLVLLREAGFDKVTTHASFPDYHTPNKIINIESQDYSFEPVYFSPETNNYIRKAGRIIRKRLDSLIFDKLRLLKLAPTFIIIANKT